MFVTKLTNMLILNSSLTSCLVHPLFSKPEWIQESVTRVLTVCKRGFSDLGEVENVYFRWKTEIEFFDQSLAFILRHLQCVRMTKTNRVLRVVET